MLVSIFLQSKEQIHVSVFKLSTFLPVSVNPSLVNVHINHPPEATVQIHQVARVKSDSEQSEENSVETVLISHLPSGPQYNDNATSNSIVAGSNQQQRPQGLIGRCYLEAVRGKVKPTLFILCAHLWSIYGPCPFMV